MTIPHFLGSVALQGKNEPFKFFWKLFINQPVLRAAPFGAALNNFLCVACVLQISKSKKLGLDEE